MWNQSEEHVTVVPVFSGLCDQGTPAVSGQYNDVRGDFQYKLTRDQGTPGDSGQCFIYFIFHHTGSQTLSNIFANAHNIAQTDVKSPPAAAYPEQY